MHLRALVRQISEAETMYRIVSMFSNPHIRGFMSSGSTEIFENVSTMEMTLTMALGMTIGIIHLRRL